VPRTVPHTTQVMKRPRRRRVAMLAAGALGLAALAAPAAQATIGVPNSGIGVHSPVAASTAFGYPDWYQDALGQQLQICLVEADCPGFLGDGSPPDETFWYNASADLPEASVVLAQEAAFGLNDGFGRIRIIDHSLVSGAAYRATTPYGQIDFTATGARNPVSTDNGNCIPCVSDADFNKLGTSDVGPNFLQWDQAVIAPPAGTLGDAATAHPVVGSTYYAPGETTPANYFRLERISGIGGAVTSLVGQTSDFVVMGNLAAGAPAGMLVNSSGSFGNQRLETTQAKVMTVRNGGGSRVDVTTVALANNEAADGYAMTGTTCTGAALDPGETCAVNLSFTPHATGAREATVVVNKTQPGGPHNFPVAGVGTIPVASAPGSVNFGSQTVGGAVQRIVTVSNTGTAPLNIGSASLVGAAGQYTLGNNLCAGATVAPNGTCTVEVFFTPTAGGQQNATLQVNSDGGNRSVALTGNGVAGAAGPGPTPPGGSGGIVGPGPGPVTGSSTLSLSQLSMSPKIKRSKVRKQGLRMVARLKDGTNVLRIRVYRKKRNGSKSLISQGFRAPSASGLYRTSLKAPKLRRDLSVGSYELEVTPGRSTGNLGTPAKYAFRVVK
jgi:hypothetical protein